jgi:hypothetical protein
VAGWTKAEFDAAYKFLPESRMGGRPAGTEPVRLHYVRAFVEPILRARWEQIVPAILNITAADHVVIIGAGFGWGVEILAELTGANVIGLDVSDYIQAEKGTDEIADYDTAMIAAGLDPNGPRAMAIKAKYAKPGARSNIVVLNEDMRDNQSRNAIRRTLGNQTPTHLVTEDSIQLFDDAAIAEFVARVAPVGAQVSHIHGGKPRTNVELNALTGHKCIQYGSTPFDVVG